MNFCRLKSCWLVLIFFSQLAFAVDEIIIDNSDIDKTVADGYWAQSSGEWTVADNRWSISLGRPPQGEDSVTNNSGGKFEWHFNIAEAGKYHVYAWWTAAGARSRFTPYTIYYGDTEIEVQVNQLQTLFAGQWILLGSYDFPAGDRSFVDIEDRGEGANADAIKIVRLNTEVYQDTNGNYYLTLPETHGFKNIKLALVDGSWQVTELDQAQWSALSLTPSGYQFNLKDFFTDGLADFVVNTADAPIYVSITKSETGYSYSAKTSIVQPRVTDFGWLETSIKAGQETAFKWYINHAQVCHETVPDSGKLIRYHNAGETEAIRYSEPGVYSKKWFCIDKYGNRFPVNENEYLEATLTVEPAGSALIVDESGIIIDNSDINNTEADGYWAQATGDWTVPDHSWTLSKGRPPQGEDSLTNNTGGKFEWHFNLAEAGNYHVFAWYAAAGRLGGAVPYTIHHGDIDSQVFVNQLQNLYAGKWLLLGNYDFPAGDGNFVDMQEVLGHGANADAIRLVRVNLDIYQDNDGNYYLTLPVTHGFTKIKLTLVGGSWTVVELNQAQWDALALTTTGEQFRLKDFHFNYSGLADVVVNTDTGPIYVVTDKDDEAYSYSAHTSIPGQRITNFEWLPATIKAGKESTFKWYINHAKICYETIENSTDLKQHSIAGEEIVRFTEPGTYTKKWFCKDRYGNRFPENENEYLEATLTVEESEVGIIVDNSDVDKTVGDDYWAVASGDWTVPNHDWTISLGRPPYKGDSLTNDTGGKFEWHFNIPEAGNYHVYTWYAGAGKLGRTVPYTIHHGDTESTVVFNQQQVLYAGKWVLLGNYDFSAGDDNFVELQEILGHGANADAVKIVRLNTDIYQDSDGNYYLTLPKTHGYMKIKLSQVDGNWSVTELNQAQWDGLALTVTGEQFRLKDFNLSGLADVVVKINTGQVYITVTEEEGVFSYSTKTSVPAQRITHFEWTAPDIKTGQESSFKWYINQGEICYETVENSTKLIQHSIAGETELVRYTEPGVHTKKWFCKDRYGNRFPENENEYLEATLTVEQAPLMVVEQFEWLPATLEAGQESSLHWQVSNADKCYQTTNGSEPVVEFSGSGQTASSVYAQVETVTSKWYCQDAYNNRFPQDPAEFIEATRTVTPIIPLEEVVVDDSDINKTSQDKIWAVKHGNWDVSSAAQPYRGQSLYNSEGDSFEWHFVLPTSENYNVYAWWTHSNLRSKSVPYRVHYGENISEVRVNQQLDTSAGQWVLIGSYVFPAGAESFVEIEGVTGAASADAIRLERVLPQESPQQPGQPSMSAPQETSDIDFSINWDAADGQYYNFKLEYQLAGSDSWQLAYSGSATSFSPGSSWTGGNYQVRLSCISSDCPIDGYITDTVNLITKPAIPTLKASVLNVKSGEDYSLQYNLPAQTTELRLFENGQQITINVNPEITTFTTKKTLVNSYDYQISACNSAGCSDLSEKVTVSVYHQATVPSAPTTALPAYPMNRLIEVVWPHIPVEQTSLYYFASGLAKDSTPEQVYQQARLITQATKLEFNELGYVWFFAKACDVLNVCSDYSTPVRIQIIAKPQLVPVSFSVSLLGESIENSTQAISVPLAQSFVIHWSAGEEVAAAGVGYYRLEQNGVLAATIAETSNELKAQYGDDLFHYGLSLDSAGENNYTLQACNQMTNSQNETLDCGPKAAVVVYAGTPIPVTAPVMLSAKQSGSQYLLEWSEIANASHYIVEYKVNGVWTVLKGDLATNSYSADASQGPEFRVSSCEQSVCSSTQEVNNAVSGDLQVVSLSSARLNAQNDGHHTLSWQVKGASRVQLISDKGHDFDNLGLQSALDVTVSDFTTFTLKISGFGEQTEQKISIVKPAAAPVVVIPRKSPYLQPLYSLGLQPIERSLLTGINQHNYVADVEGKLYRISDQGEIKWTIQLPGLVANKPLWASDDSGAEYLFFAVSKTADSTQSSLGQLCRISINGENLSCFELANNAIASPVLYQGAGEASGKARLFLVDINGMMHEFVPFAASFVTEDSQPVYSQQLLVEQQAIRVLTSPQIDYKNNFLIVRSEDNGVQAFELPEVSSSLDKGINKLLKALPDSLSKMFTDETNNDTNKPAQTNAVWSRKLD
ncbi:hypothetical protein [Thalassomonas haliotis]|uniref:Fibronectin type-III domain-containing protein n=1 Tax=Thalassomonas haliotis TaxID=485448 RepID=A0ABY7VIU3_9GAMM|nr:hypothetical protein [Thalassomonas haliotis]WDE13664.1 hypothetical protein H3N35_09635 [Thalassomonas haliotis]